ncbi:tRNA (adenosine(37)-N6)-threonylcarbamoyltransferase complex dimerization subunit type 1 TsaB [Porticoccaceae bacterium]|nr:tRNA (adenosine(37)-N6)-threonylcarbamoyltransferase complex dimerization subunit type 1 TsaB [Porticoccaceae bacterium]MDA9014328.1 tRNA (adenosine(37)-N6)-threonylcarbamoyltransferase complex dimerization subunit type 1 TsaB [Porticoccaceae bacterium]
MTTILAVDTSTEACSVALQIGNETIAQYADEPRSHSRLLMPMVQQVLAEAQIKVNQLDAIGVSIGPGSFTGLRIGFAAVQGMAYGADIPVTPVSTLELIAATFRRQQNIQAGDVITLLDARMSEFNLGRYRLDKNNQIVALEADQLVSTEQALELIKANQPSAIIGDAGNLFESAPQHAELFTPIYPNAIDLLPMAKQQLDQGSAVNIESVDLVYLRGTEAWQKRKRLRATQEQIN